MKTLVSSFLMWGKNTPLFRVSSSNTLTNQKISQTQISALTEHKAQKSLPGNDGIISKRTGQTTAGGKPTVIFHNTHTKKSLYFGRFQGDYSIDPTLL